MNAIDELESFLSFAQEQRDLHFARAEKLHKALSDILRVIEMDELIPESVSYMKQARDALQSSTGG
jgi:hypothetical protein